MFVSTCREPPDIQMLSNINSKGFHKDIEYKGGDNGHPCFVPLDMENGYDNIPTKYSRANGLEYNAVMADKIFPLNPKVSRVLVRYCQ